MADTITEWQGQQIIKLLEKIYSELQDIKREMGTLDEIRKELLKTNARLLQIEMTVDHIDGKR